MTVTRHPVTPRHEVYGLMDAIHQACDGRFAQLVEAGEAVGLPLLCRPGCSACCTYLAHTFAADIVPAVSAIERLPAPIRQRVIDRLGAWYDLYTANPRYARDPLGEHGATRAAWGARSIPCPMLDPQTRTCLVYDDRPMVCRSMHAVRRAEGVAPACPTCPDLEAPAACVVRPEHARCGHEPWVFQLRPDIQPEWDLSVIAIFTRQGISPIWAEPGVLPKMVLEQGALLFGWAPKRTVTLPIWTEVR